MAILVNITLGCTGCRETSILADLSGALVTQAKSFIALRPGANDIKLYTSKFYQYSR
jgi:hypothetical protein